MKKRTTILFPLPLHRHLVELAEQRETSLGDLVRKACEAQYGFTSPQRRLQAVWELGAICAPLATPAAMKRESAPLPEDIL